MAMAAAMLRALYVLCRVYFVGTLTDLQEIYLWDLHAQRIVQKYAGHQQSQHVIRSCFGGVDGNFIASGSEGSSQ